jgi:S-adenosylmethionine:tRNA ribosyltransferase-isomerase
MHPAYSEWEMDPVTLNPLRTERLGGVLVSEPARRFTKEMLSSFTARGINSVDVSLRMAFAYHPQAPATSLDDYTLNPEEYEISVEAAAQLRQTLSGGGRVFSIGTSTVRVLETLQCPTQPSRGRSNIFIHPGTDIRHVDCLLTGLHNPMSTHVMMATAFGGRELVLKACQCAADKGYRFGVHGDVMLILNQRKRALCNCADIG